MKKATEPLGALGDLGWYTMRLTLWAFDFEDPEAVSCNFTEATDEGVPIRVLANFKFSRGRTASFDCSFTHAWRNWGELVSEKRYLRLEDFVITAKPDVCSFSVIDCSCGPKAISFPQEVTTTEIKQDKAQHTKLIERFSNIVTSGKLEDHWPKIALQTNLMLLKLVES